MRVTAGRRFLAKNFPERATRSDHPMPRRGPRAHHTGPGFRKSALFKPSEYRGIAVLRAHSPIAPHELEELCLTLIGGLTREDLDRKLWIVHHPRIPTSQHAPPH